MKPKQKGVFAVNDSTFIGMGTNPEGPDLPQGFGMQLSQNPKALNAFAKMPNDQKNALIRGMQGATTGEDAAARMANAIEQLTNNE